MPAGAQTTLESVLPLAAALGLLTSASTRPKLYNMAPAPDHPRFIQGRVIKSPVCRIPSRLGRPVWRHGCSDGRPAGPADPPWTGRPYLSQGAPLWLLPASDQRGVRSISHPCFLLLLLLPQINSIFFLFPKDLVENHSLIMIANTC